MITGFVTAQDAAARVCVPIRFDLRPLQKQNTDQRTCCIGNLCSVRRKSDKV